MICETEAEVMGKYSKVSNKSGEIKAAGFEQREIGCRRDSDVFYCSLGGWPLCIQSLVIAFCLYPSVGLSLISVVLL